MICLRYVYVGLSFCADKIPRCQQPQFRMIKNVMGIILPGLFIVQHRIEIEILTI